MRIFACMKSRVNLTIDEALLDKVKGYAAQRHTSVSELVETYFEHLTKPAGRKNILKLVDQLPGHTIDNNMDLKKLYYEKKAK
jgi:hypothetical protein